MSSKQDERLLKPDELKELRDIVGEKWVSDDLCVRDAYSIYYNSSSLNREGDVWAPRPAAVVLPETAEEVASVTRFCNNHDFMIKPFSTGWIAMSAAGSRKTILLDLKRMNKILDIDVKNRIAVVEPYVTGIQLQCELWKLGLNVHVVSCGGNHSILASAVAAWGYGLTGASMGYQARNLMGFEWVDPKGEIVRFGSAAYGNEWFCADGPGPGTRGLIRGFLGTFGGLGTFTKCSVKLYRWDGPGDVEYSGKSPRYFLDTPLPNTEFFILLFPGRKEIADAGYELGAAECDYADFRLPAFFIALQSTDNNLELKNLWGAGIFQKVGRYGIIVCVHGHSKREFDWKIKALKEITRQNKGLRFPFFDPPKGAILKVIKPLMGLVDNPLELAAKFPRLQDALDKIPIPEKSVKKMNSSMYHLCLRHAVNTQGCFRPSSCMFTSVGAFDTWDLGFEQNEFLAGIKKPAIEKGHIVDDGADLGCGGTFDSGHMGYLEGIGLYSAFDEDSCKATAQIVKAGAQGCIDKALGVPLGAIGGPMNELFGPHCSDFHLVIKKIKEALDPNSSCDSWTYSGPSNKAFPEEKGDFTMF